MAQLVKNMPAIRGTWFDPWVEKIPWRREQLLTPIHSVKSFGVIDETEVDVFLEFPSFIYDPENVDNLISGFSSF